MLSHRILVAASELQERLELVRILESEGFLTATARNDEEVVAALRYGDVRLVVLEAQLPAHDGATCCHEIRQNSDIPIIIYGDSDGPVSATEAFAAGADDFVSRPLDPELLVARMRAILRRARPVRSGATLQSMTRVQVGDLVVDHTTQRAGYGDAELDLSVKELQVLFLLAQNVGELVHRGELLQTIWGDDVSPESKTLDVHVSRLRKKLQGIGLSQSLIKTVRNRGYLLSADIVSADLDSPLVASR